MMVEGISGLYASGVRLAVSAHNVANVMTPDFRASRAIQTESPIRRGTDVYVNQTGSPTDLGEEAIEQASALRYAKANGTLVRVQGRMLGTLIDMFA
jgi:flagellar basal-body rod protein FlgC